MVVREEKEIEEERSEQKKNGSWKGTKGPSSKGGKSVSYRIASLANYIISLVYRAAAGGVLWRGSR